jgi:2'-hydroxyisoflavone reductase
MSDRIITRRRFLGTAAGISGLAAAGLWGGPQAFGLSPQEKPTSQPGSKLKLLILGGTGFLGPHVVRYALSRGHSMTLFNRGRTNPGLFKDLETLIGNRNKDVKALEGRKWDAVIDTSAYIPRGVKLTTSVLKDNVAQYIMISSVSVYPDADTKDTDESSRVGKLDDETIEKVDGNTYGPLKALCEKAAEDAMPGRVANIRPGLIVGPGDDTDRWTYWPERVSRGGEMIAPLGPDQIIQYIDVRDLAEWIVHLIEKKTCGVMNALGPEKPTKLGDLLDSAKKVTKAETKIHWVDDAFMKAENIQPWGDMPAWFPPGPGMDRPAIASNAKAIANGLKFRPLETTVADTLAWHKAERPKDYKLQAGLDPAREQDLVAKWKAKAGGK